MKTSFLSKLFAGLGALAIATCGGPLQVGHFHGMSINCALAALFTYLGIHNASNTSGTN